MQVLTDAQWAKFEAAIAAVKLRRARPRKEDCRTIEAIIWRLDNGAKWRSIPAELGNWHHAYLRFRRWTVSGVWDRIMAHVVAEGEPNRPSPASTARLRARTRGRPEHGRTNRCAESAIAAPAATRRLWDVRGAVLAARSSVSATLLAGSSTLSWCQARRTNSPPHCCC